MNLFEQMLFEFSDKFKSQYVKAKTRHKKMSDADRELRDELFDYLADDFSKHFKPGLENMAKGASGGDIRFSFKKEEENNLIKTLSVSEAQLYLITLLQKDERFKDLIVSVSEPKKNFPGAKLSSQFYTFVITKKNEVPDIGVFAFYLIYNLDNSKKVPSKLSGAQLKPDWFNINGKHFTYESLASEIKDSIDSRKLDSEIKDFLLETLDMIDDESNYIRNKDSITLKRSDNHKKLTPESTNDCNIIYKNFGEIIQPLVISKFEGGDIFFPAEANKPFIDFTIDDTEYSTKYKIGAAPSMRNLAEGFYKETEDVVGRDSLIITLYDTILDTSMTSSTASIFLAQHMGHDSYEALIDFMEGPVSPDKSFPIVIDEKIIEYWENGILEEKLLKFITNGKLDYKMSQVEKYLNDEFIYDDQKRPYGLVLYPIKTTLKTLLNNNYMNVKQDVIDVISANSNIVQMKTYDSMNEIKFIFEYFAEDDITVKFLAGGSIGDPNNQSIRFSVSLN